MGFYRYCFKMDFNSKNYQSVKLKKLKLNYSKALNGITLKLFKNSIFTNIRPIVCSFILFINSNFKTTELQLSSIKKDLKPSFELISVKLNNKIYSTSQLKGLNTFSYRKNVFNLYGSLDQHLKTSYLLTKKKK